MNNQDIQDVLRYCDIIEELCDASIFALETSISMLDRYGVTFLCWSSLGRNLVALRTPEALLPYRENNNSTHVILREAIEEIQTFYNGVFNVSRL
jgi:hypothetical protein